MRKQTPTHPRNHRNRRIMVIGDIMESQFLPPETVGISRYWLASTVWRLGVVNTYLSMTPRHFASHKLSRMTSSVITIFCLIVSVQQTSCLFRSYCFFVIFLLFFIGMTPNRIHCWISAAMVAFTAASRRGAPPPTPPRPFAIRYADFPGGGSG
jgi:hypothetical protein